MKVQNVSSNNYFQNPDFGAIIVFPKSKPSGYSKKMTENSLIDFIIKNENIDSGLRAAMQKSRDESGNDIFMNSVELARANLSKDEGFKTLGSFIVDLWNNMTQVCKKDLTNEKIEKLIEADV